MGRGWVLAKMERVDALDTERSRDSDTSEWLDEYPFGYESNVDVIAIARHPRGKTGSTGRA